MKSGGCFCSVFIISELTRNINVSLFAFSKQCLVRSRSLATACPSPCTAGSVCCRQGQPASRDALRDVHRHVPPCFTSPHLTNQGDQACTTQADLVKDCKTFEECRLLGCYAVWLLYEPMFRRNLAPRSSG
jgi:hypothetical protein